MLERESLQYLTAALEKLEAGFDQLPAFAPKVDQQKLEAVMLQVAERMQDNYPYFHPYYAGQMLKPPHPVARLAYMLAMWINPNNHALDGGRASSEMEKEVVADLASMVGWEQHLGHLTGGGTVANLEALWINKCINSNKLVLASAQSHYTHSRISEVLGLPFQSVPCTDAGIMDLNALEALLEHEDVGMVVATLGTTGVGTVDPLPEILALCRKHKVRVHADCAYGGYFLLAENLSPQTRKKYASLKEVDSWVIDPHKHGLQPYGCGCIIFRDPAVGALYKHDSPYTYFSSTELHLGEISLECSRAGASAVGLWATHQYLPPVRGGEFAADLAACIDAARTLYKCIESDDRFLPLFEPEIDIVCWAPQGDSTSQISEKSQELFDLSAQKQVHLALLNYPVSNLPPTWDKIPKDSEYVTCLRSVLMKPEHKDWVLEIWDKIQSSLG